MANKFEQQVDDLARRAVAATQQPTRPVEAPPRIVCTECPAVAKVHYWNNTGGTTYEIWCECHDRHVFGNLFMSSPGVKRDVLLRDIQEYGDERVNSLYENAERRMQEYAEQANVYKRFLERRPGE